MNSLYYINDFSKVRTFCYVTTYFLIRPRGKILISEVGIRISRDTPYIYHVISFLGQTNCFPLPVYGKFYLGQQYSKFYFG